MSADRRLGVYLRCLFLQNCGFFSEKWEKRRVFYKNINKMKKKSKLIELISVPSFKYLQLPVGKISESYFTNY